MSEIVKNATPSFGFKRVVHIVIGFLRARALKNKGHELTEK